MVNLITALYIPVHLVWRQRNCVYNKTEYVHIAQQNVYSRTKCRASCQSHHLVVVIMLFRGAQEAVKNEIR